MKLIDIAQLPTCIEYKHESLLRSYQLLQKVKEYLEAEVPHKIILELIAEIESVVVK
jgi:hypothetical protein